MIPAAFTYHRASSVDEASRMLAQNEDAKLLAGGHSLIPLMRLRLAQPTALVDINALDNDVKAYVTIYKPHWIASDEIATYNIV